MKIKKIKQKRAQEHLEIIISFIIFVGFLIFLFAFFSPFKAPKNDEVSRSVFLNLEENLTTKLSSISITIKNPQEIQGSGKNCFTIDETNELLKDLGCSESNVLIVKNQVEDIVNSNIQSNNDKIDISFSPESQLYTLYCARDLDQTESTSSECHQLQKSQGNYAIGIIYERKVWSVKTLGEFKEKYKNEYEKLKKDLMPSNTEFSFSVNDETGSELFSGKKTIPRGVNVYPEITPIDVMENNAKIKKATISIIVW